MAIDKALVAATFAETKSKRKTARRLGISEEHVYGILRGMADRCIRCGVAVKNGRQCPDCNDFDRNRIRAKREERSLLGLCTDCGEPRSPLSRAKCEAHRKAGLLRNRTYAKKRRQPGSAFHLGRNTIERRAKTVLRTYGQSAADLWAEHDGCCQICGQRHGECSVQIHHIDEDRENGSRENLAVLCFDCHQATHRLLVLKARERFLAWFAERYAQK